MTTKRKPRIDIHTHVTVPEVQAIARKVRIDSSAPGTQDWVPAASKKIHESVAAGVEDKLTDPRARIADMDAMGVDIQIVSQNLPNCAFWAGDELGQAMARACNDGIARFVEQMPDRYAGVGAVPMQNPDLAIKELEYARALGLKGVQIQSHVRGRELGEAQFRPFWSAAEQLQMPVIVHPRGFTHDERLHKFFLWNSIGQPLEEALAIASLIHEGILEDYPRLKLVISHGGGYLTFYPGRIQRAYDARPEPRENISRPPIEYMRRMYYDSVIFDPDMLSFLVRKVGSSKIMMGTDYPRGEVEEDPVGFVGRAPDLTDEDRERIMSTNAMELFGLG
ncbi:MAG: hypothetical protein RLZ98_453 [Pseudomonadota bacterium]|jgi:aminocarboxymuconate-semialdehyde decarboxylase